MPPILRRAEEKREGKRKIKKVIVENSENELEKFKTALNKVEKEIEETIQQSSGTEKEIMNAYLMILKDPTLVIETENLIKNLKYNAEYAIEEGFNKIIEMFKKINDEYMAERAKDIIDIKEKLLDKILKDENIKLNKLPQNTIIVTKELTTSETAKLDFKNVSGIITEIGGINSHTAIMARTHSLPLITEIHNINEIFNNEQYICMNGSTGEIFINPTKEEENNLLEQQKLIEEEKNKLEEYKNKETKTKDGFKVDLVSNIGIPSDVEKVIESTAEGIGLFRTEFLYMDNEKMPTEEEQFLSYKEVAEKMQGKPVIIRTLDVGGDKEIKYLNLPKEENPFLGFRAIRICLANIEMFKIQLRAILKASAEIALTHHEWWNGNGYPNKLSGEDIPLFGRITSVADVFDALSHDRCYKKAWPMEEVIDYMLKMKDVQFQGVLVDLLVENLDEFIKIKTEFEDKF